jgi:NAD(P)-dependent dehydrogenase (short-subunit alcohol dehydrogenase family)
LEEGAKRRSSWAGSTSREANAGIGLSPALSQDITEPVWRNMIDINLTGVWHATKPATPHLIEGEGAGR